MTKLKMRENNNIWLYIALLLIIIPVAILPPRLTGEGVLTIRETKDLIFQIGILALLLFYIPTDFLKLFYGYALVSFLLHYGQSSQHDIIYLSLGFAFLSLVYHKYEKRYDRLIMNSICIGALIVAGVAIAQHFGHLGFWIKGYVPHMKPISTFCNPNMSGSFLAISSIFFIRRKWWIGLFIMIPAQYYTGSHASWIAGSLACVVLASKHIRTWKVIILLILTLFWTSRSHKIQEMASTICGNGDNIRMRTWKEVLDFQFISGGWHEFEGQRYEASPSPIVGYGLGQFRVYSLVHRFGSKQWSNQFHENLHNDYIQAIFEYGLIGFSLLFVPLLILLILSVRTRDLYSIALIASLINASANFLFHTSVAILPILCIAILIKKRNTNADLCLLDLIKQRRSH